MLSPGNQIKPEYVNGFLYQTLLWNCIKGLSFFTFFIIESVFVIVI